MNLNTALLSVACQTVFSVSSSTASNKCWNDITRQLSNRSTKRITTAQLERERETNHRGNVRSWDPRFISSTVFFVDPHFNSLVCAATSEGYRLRHAKCWQGQNQRQWGARKPGNGPNLPDGSEDELNRHRETIALAVVCPGQEVIRLRVQHNRIVLSKTRRKAFPVSAFHTDSM